MSYSGPVTTVREADLAKLIGKSYYCPMQARNSVRRKIAIISVISDLVTDQRVHRTAITLAENGVEVILVGRKLRSSAEPTPRPYRFVRFRLLMEKGPLFYFSFNVRLFFFLIFRRADILVSNDLDTLLANYLVSKFRKVKLYYDSHEYYTGVPELENHPAKRKIWKRLERWILPKLKHAFTVNDSIASLYFKEYGIRMQVVRNVPIVSEKNTGVKSRSELGIPEGKRILLFQGAGINIHRGAEEAMEAMLYLENFILLFIGSGDVIESLKRESIALNLGERVKFIPRQPMETLHEYTRAADAGITIDKDTNINYRFSLPNKLFDYIQAGLPVIASEIPEVSRIVRQYDIGVIITSHDPKHLASAVTEMFRDETRLAKWKANLKIAAADLNWNKERVKLLQVFKDVI